MLRPYSVYDRAIKEIMEERFFNNIIAMVASLWNSEIYLPIAPVAEPKSMDDNCFTS